MAPRGDKNGIKAYASRVNKKNRSNRLPFHPDAVRLKIKAVLLVRETAGAHLRRARNEHVANPRGRDPASKVHP